MTDTPTSPSTPRSPDSRDDALVPREQAERVAARRLEVRAAEQRRAERDPHAMKAVPGASMHTFPGTCHRCGSAFEYEAPAVVWPDGRARSLIGPIRTCKAAPCAAADAADLAAENAAEYERMRLAELKVRQRAYVEHVPALYHRRARLAPASLTHLVPELAEWDETKSLYLYGPPSSGKSHQVACLMHRVAGRVSMAWWSTRDLIAQLEASYGKRSKVDRPVIFDDPCGPKVLVLNDLFAERATEHAVTKLGNLVDKRYEAGLAIVVTSNIAPAQIPNRAEDTRDASVVRLELRRIADRLIEMSSAPHGIRHELADANWRHLIAERGQGPE